MKTKRLFVIALVLFGIFFASEGIAQAINSFYKQVTGIGNVDYTEEVTFTDLQVSSPTKIKVTLTSNSSTVASYVYTVTLYLDGVVSGSSTQSWTAGQIPGTSKIITFSGLSLGSITAIGTEITK